MASRSKTVMNEKYAFEVMEAENNEVRGLVFKTIQKGDTLSVAEASSNRRIQVIDIILYGQHLESIERGLTCILMIENTHNIDLSETKYLYF